MTPLNSNLPPVVQRTSRIYTLILATAGSTQSIQRVQVPGSQFYIVDQDVPDTLVSVKSDRTTAELYGVGTGKVFPDYFEALEFENLSASAITLTVFIGFGDYIDKRFTVVGGRGASSMLPVYEPKTKPVAGTTNPIGAATAIALSGTPPNSTYLRRKAITVSNLDANLNIQIRDAAHNILLTIFASTSIILPISDDCEIYNPQGAPIQISYGSIWWMK